MAKLGAILSRYKGDLGKVHSRSVNELSNRIIDGTPIGETGRAAGSWSQESPPKIGRDYKFSSNLEYIHALEYGVPGFNYSDGREAHSPQAPRGMVRINVRNWDSIVRSKL